jgi:hypothetical protein
MKRLTAFAMVVLSCAPATAQTSPRAQQPAVQRQAQAQAQGIEVELLEMEQDVDKSILREALLLLGRAGMTPGPQQGKLQADEDVAAMRAFVEKKKEAIIARDAELKKRRLGGTRGTTTTTAPTAVQPDNADRQADIEKLENAQIETQLLQAQINLLQPDLTSAIDALAAADIAASKDETQRPKADEARREYQKIKAKYVEHSKRLPMEQRELLSIQRMMGMGGMGGGGGGGGGGFR